MAATPEVVNFLKEWDVSQTEKLLLQLHEKQELFKLEEEALLKEEKKRLVLVNER